MKMRRILSVTLILAMLLTLAACGGGAAATKMTMGTGGTAGTYYAFGGVLGQYIKNHAGIDVTVVSTYCSKANIESIAARYATLKVLDISSNSFHGAENELLALKELSNLIILYADNTCSNVDLSALAPAVDFFKYVMQEV